MSLHYSLQNKSRSESIARSLGYSVNSALPLMEGEVLKRSVGEVIERAAALNCVVAVAHGCSRDLAKAWIMANSLEEVLSENERKFVFGPASKEDRYYMLKAESLWVFAWILQKIEAISFAEGCGDILVDLMPDILASETVESWRIGLQLRGEQEILAECDLVYRLHWAIRDAQLGSRSPPGVLHPAIVLERRRALEWMIQDCRWDDLALDT